MKRIGIIALILLLLCAGAQAEGIADKYVEDVTRVLISKPSITLYAGRSFVLLSKVYPASRAYEKVTWSSENELVATVAQDGRVTAVKAGSSVIEAACEGFTARCRVTVLDTPVKAFTLNAKEIYIAPGDTYPLAGETFTPSYVPDRTLVYESLNPAAATVNADTGLIAGVGVGTAIVRATAKSGASALCTVNVVSEVRAQKLTLSAAKATLGFGRTLQLRADVFPVNCVAEDKIVAYESSNAAVATVDDTGLVRAGTVKGTAKITATTANGRAASCLVTVKNVLVKSVTLDQAALTLKAGEQATLTATIKPATATVAAASWRSGNEDVATVSASGAVTAVAPSSAVIWATAGAQKTYCRVTVKSAQAKTVTITAAGDITIGGDPRFAPAQPASLAYYTTLYNAYGGKFFKNVEGAFTGENEITLVNLESSLTTSKQYRNKSYVLRAPQSYAHILSDVSVDVVGHGNNHANDFTGGAKDTQRAVQAHNMAYIGNGRTAIVTQNGVKVGFCAFSMMDGTGVATVRNVVKRLSKSCHVVVASFHWGTDFTYTVNASQKAVAHAAVLAGADLVVGHHPHVVSGVEKYKDKYIVYSLGTLSSAIMTPKDMDAMIFRQSFSVDTVSGYVGDAGVRVAACTMSTNENKNNALPDFLGGADKQRVLDKIKYYSKGFAQSLPETVWG